MIAQLPREQRRHILVDVDTQRGLLLAGGGACIRNHRRVLERIRRVMAWARRNRINVISTCRVCPDSSHCCGDPFIDGAGEQKIGYTLLNKRAGFPADSSACLPIDVLRRHRQVILHKRCIDPFEEPRIDRLLSEVLAGEFILIGACAEDAVLATCLGMLQRDKSVAVVADAVGYHGSREGKLALLKMEAKGARLIETRILAGATHLRLVGACGCDACCGIGKALVRQGSC